MTRLGIQHLKRAVQEAGLPIRDFVAMDGLEPYIHRLEKRVSTRYLSHLRDIWRQAFRHLCRKRLGAIPKGKNWLIPWTAVLAYQTERAQ